MGKTEVVDADLAKYFDTIPHRELMKRVARRVSDGMILKLIKAMIVVRFADDYVVGFQEKEDAERLLRHLQERLAQFALELHPGKTRLIEFGRFAARKRFRRGLGQPDTFDFLGLTHKCGVSREGNFLLMRHSSSKRMGRKLRAIRDALRRHLHQPIPVQGRWLAQVFRGYANYHGVPTNSRAVNTFRGQLIKSWYRSLRRRSQKRRIDWLKLTRLARRWIPANHICHPWPQARFDAKHSRQEPGAVVPLAGICAGGAGKTRVPTATSSSPAPC